jgi:hypothetical protein
MTSECDRTCDRCGQTDDWFRTCAECAKRCCIDCLNPWGLKTDGDVCTICARPLLPDWHPARDHKGCAICGATLQDDGEHCPRCRERRMVSAPCTCEDFYTCPPCVARGEQIARENAWREEAYQREIVTCASCGEEGMRRAMTELPIEKPEWGDYPQTPRQEYACPRCAGEVEEDR